RPALVQVTVPALLAQPASADTNVVPAGRASITVNPALSLGPRFVTWMKNDVSVPAIASDPAVLVTARSAERLTVVWLVELSLVWSGSLVALVPICAVLARSAPSA